VSVADVARAAFLETNRLPAGLEPGLEATRFYDPIRGTFAAGAQAAVVEVDPATGTIAILRYACAEDTGRVINPLIVEGQVLGAIFPPQMVHKSASFWGQEACVQARGEAEIFFP
jgi:carbon-monoxide dehydrogenase large subunit